MNEWGEYEYSEMPKIGETVYIVWGNEIYKEKIYAIGKDFFIPTNYKKCTDRFSEIKFSSYGKNWFYQLGTAKDKVLEYLYEESEIVQGDKNWWYVNKL